MNVFMQKDVYLDIFEEASRYPDTETGGVWLGQSDGGSVRILKNLRPGPNAVHRPMEFAYDADAIEESIRDLRRHCEIPLHVLGYWHTHGSGRDTFSEGDSALNRAYASMVEGGAVCGLVTRKEGFRLSLYRIVLPLAYERLNYTLL